MDDRIHFVVADQPRHQCLISSFTDDERRAFGNGPTKAGGEVIEHYDAFTGVDQFMNHLAADIAGAAGDQECHECDRLRSLCLPQFPENVVGPGCLQAAGTSWARAWRTAAKTCSGGISRMQR